MHGIKLDRPLTSAEKTDICNRGNITKSRSWEGGFIDDERREVRFCNDKNTELCGNVTLLLTIAQIILQFGITITHTSENATWNREYTLYFPCVKVAPETSGTQKAQQLSDEQIQLLQEIIKR